MERRKSVAKLKKKKREEELRRIEAEQKEREEAERKAAEEKRRAAEEEVERKRTPRSVRRRRQGGQPRCGRGSSRSSASGVRVEGRPGRAASAGGDARAAEGGARGAVERGRGGVDPRRCALPADEPARADAGRGRADGRPAQRARAEAQGDAVHVRPRLRHERRPGGDVPARRRGDGRRLRPRLQRDRLRVRSDGLGKDVVDVWRRARRREARHRAADGLARLRGGKGKDASVRVSFLQIYNEQVDDLLEPAAPTCRCASAAARRRRRTSSSTGSAARRRQTRTRCSGSSIAASPTARWHRPR